MNTSAFPNGNRPDGSGTDSQNAFSSAAPCPQAASPAQQIPAPVLLSDLHAHRASFSRIGTMLLLGYQLFAFLVSFVVGRFAPDIAKTWWYSWVLTDVSLYGIGLPLMWLILRQVPAAPFNPTYRARGIVAEKPRFGFGWWILIAVIGMGAMEIGALVGQGFMKLLSYLVGYDYANGLETIVSGSPLWATFLGTVVLAPLGEEFIFRKLLIAIVAAPGSGSGSFGHPVRSVPRQSVSAFLYDHVRFPAGVYLHAHGTVGLVCRSARPD